jgi:cell division protein FtsW (lipid II flippase)
MNATVNNQARLARRDPPLVAAPRVRWSRRGTELGLLFMGWVVVVVAYILTSLGTGSAALGGRGYIPADIGVFLAMVIGLSLAAHLANRWLAREADPVILPVVALLNGLGWVMIARLDSIPSVAAANGNAHLAALQAAWTAIGVVLYIATLAVVRRGSDLGRYRYLTGLAGIALLISPLLPVVGRDINGSRLWLYLGPLHIQPVEIAKLALVIFFASYLAEKRELLASSTLRVGDHLLPDLRPFGPLLVAFGFAVLIIAAENDIGFALIIFMLFLVMLWIATGRALYVLIGMVLFVLAAFIGVHLFSQANERITVWLHPFAHAATSGYQLVQGEFALANGGITGSGLGLGQPGLVPVVATDMIFTAFGEELGLVGVTALLVAFLVLVGAGLRISLRSRGDFTKLLAAGLTVVLALQALIIIAGIIRLLPLTGVTLPFVAYGGSSLVANYVLVAILMRLSNDNRSVGTP